MRLHNHRRRFRARLAPVLLSVSLLLSLVPGGVRSSLGRENIAAAPVLVLDVQQNASTIYVSPVTLYENGRFNAPYAPAKAEAARRRFVEKYFTSGKTYFLIFGGGNAGRLRVTDGYWQDGAYAYGQLEPADDVKGRIRGQIHALATDWDTTARGSAWRRSPTPEERAAAIALAKTVYLQNKVSAALLAKMEVVNLTAIDVDGDDHAELVGTFKVPQARKEKPPHHLFLIAEGEGRNYRAAAAEYSFKPGQDEYPLGSELMSDYMDIDGDGTGEIVTTYTGPQFIDSFRIYQRKNGAWTRVYAGGGAHG